MASQPHVLAGRTGGIARGRQPDASLPAWRTRPQATAVGLGVGCVREPQPEAQWVSEAVESGVSPTVERVRRAGQSGAVSANAGDPGLGPLVRRPRRYPHRRSRHESDPTLGTVAARATARLG